MPGIASDMNLSQFIRRFVSHLTAAMSVLFVLLTVGEYFVPGTVLPFIDVVDAAIVILVLLSISLILAKKETE